MTLTRIIIILNILFASLSVQAQELPFTIDAKTFSYSEDGNRFIAEGEVYVFSDTQSLKADKLIYDKLKDKIYAIGDVVIIDESSNVTYTKNIELTGDFKSGVAKHIIVMFGGGTGMLQSSKAVKVDESKLNLFNADYSSCPLEGGQSRAWSIKAEKISYNSAKEYIIYRNAVFKIKDIPVMYLPMFYHSTNLTKPVTGFLNPSLSSSSADGFGFRAGFFWAINQNQDATFRLQYLGERGSILGAEHRYVGEKLNTDIRVEGLEDKKYNKHARGLLSANVEYVFEEGKRAGFNAKVTSDEDYLDEFKDVTDSYTSSTLYAEDAGKDYYIGASSRYFMDMRSDIDDAKLAQPVARVQLEKVLKTDDNGGQFKMNSDILSLTRRTGQDMNRISSKAEYTKPVYTKDGSLFEFNTSLRGNYYTFNKNTATSSDETDSMILPEASILWDKPFASNNFNHVITPKLMFITSPNLNYNDTPNEDSTSFELDATNLFETNRFSGLDRFETGTRVVYGVDTKYGSAETLNLQAFLGQSYNFSQKEENITDDTKSNNKNSDWVGFIKVNPNENIQAATNFRLGSDTFSTQRIDSSLKLSKKSKFADSLDLERDYITLVHSFLKDDSEEINLYGYYNLNEDVALKARIQRNMYENITLTQELEAIYQSCCYNLSFKVRKKQSDDDDTENSIDFLFNFSILPSGRK
jgi:LPS-assembly protein